MPASTHAEHYCNSRINECMLAPFYLHQQVMFHIIHLCMHIPSFNSSTHWIGERGCKRWVMHTSWISSKGTITYQMERGVLIKASLYKKKKYNSFKAPQTSATIWAFKHIFMRKFSPTNWLTFCYMPDTLWSPPGWMSMAGPHEVGHNSMGIFTDKMVVTFFNARHLMMPIQWVPRPHGPPLRKIFIGFVTSSKIKDSTLEV